MLLLKQTDEIGNRLLRAEVAYKTCFPSHMHDHFELELILEGSGSFTVNGTEYPIRKNTLTIMTPAHVHSIRSEGILLFNVEFAGGETLPVWDYREPFVVQPSDSDARFLRTLLTEVRETFEENPAYASRLFACVLEKAMHCKNNVEQGDSSHVSRIFLYVMEHFRSDLTLKSMAEHFGFSPSYMSDLFSRRLGVCFKEYLDSLRFSYACSQLTFTDDPIKAVCMMAGFSDYANFSRRFREKYGKTPRDYRNETKKETLG
ncbi:MAG: helix-turn-helix transcriptional regulator [Oscillospiraceae bacterium]|nr:helix-turn-helix transcriptional regulator [Oscillospiraceae bacterium]